MARKSRHQVHEVSRLLQLHDAEWPETEAGRLYEVARQGLRPSDVEELLEHVEHAERQYWRELLSYQPAAETVLSVVERWLPTDARGEVARVRQLSQRYRRSGNPDQWASATARLADAVHKLDSERLVIREADRAVHRLAGLYEAERDIEGDDIKITERFRKYLERVSVARHTVPNALARRLPLPLYEAQGEPPPGLSAAVCSVSAELLAHLKNHPRELYRLRPRQFEELVAEVLASYGWAVELTPESKDGGYDIYAITSDRSGVRSAWVIECKKYSQHRKVGVEIVRGLYGTGPVQNGANALIATTSTFTKGAQDYKATRLNLELRGYEGMLEWIHAYHPHPCGRLYLEDHRIQLK